MANHGLIEEVEKNANEVIRIALTEYRGHELLDVRVYYRDDEGDYKPCRKGVSLRVDMIDDLHAAIEKAAEMVRTT